MLCWVQVHTLHGSLQDLRLHETCFFDNTFQIFVLCNVHLRDSFVLWKGFIYISTEGDYILPHQFPFVLADLLVPSGEKQFQRRKLSSQCLTISMPLMRWLFTERWQASWHFHFPCQNTWYMKTNSCGPSDEQRKHKNKSCSKLIIMYKYLRKKIQKVQCI